jgi:cytoskeleton protein RodZ
MPGKLKESFGQYLRRERTLREISLEEIAQFTKIKLSILSALENDDYTSLPPLPFVRGFIRTYAEYLGLNVPEVMLRFSSFIEENHAELIIPAPVVRSSERRIRRGLLLGFFAVLILGFFFTVIAI